MNAAPSVVGRLNSGEQTTTLMRVWVAPGQERVAHGRWRVMGICVCRGYFGSSLYGPVNKTKQNRTKRGKKFPKRSQVLPSLDQFSEPHRSRFITHSLQGQGTVTLWGKNLS